MSVKLIYLHMCDRCGNVANTVEHTWAPGAVLPMPARDYLTDNRINADLCSICAPEIRGRLNDLLKKPSVVGP